MEHRLEGLATEFAIRTGAAHQFVGVVDVPHALDAHAEQRLRQYIEGRARDPQGIETPRAGALSQRDAFEDIGQAQRDECAGCDAIDASSAASQALQRAAHAAWRTDQQHLVDGCEVHAEFEAARCDHGFERAIRESFFDFETLLAIDGSMMHRDAIFVLFEDHAQREAEAFGS